MNQDHPESLEFNGLPPPYSLEGGFTARQEPDGQPVFTTMPTAPLQLSSGTEKQITPNPPNTDFREQPPSYSQDSEQTPLQKVFLQQPDTTPEATCIQHANLTQITIEQPAVTGPLPPGSCPVCRNTEWASFYPFCAWVICCCFFPSGLLCCLYMRQKRCTSCGLTIKSSPSSLSVTSAVVFIVIWVIIFCMVRYNMNDRY